MANVREALVGESAFRRRDSWALSAAVVTLLAACAYLVGIRAVPVTDRDEPRFAQASRQMAEGEGLADWIVPRVGEEIRLKKPPLVYWAQAPTVLALTGGDPSRDAIWMYRLPSAIAAWLAGLVTLRLGRRMFGGNVGLLAACLLVVSPVLAVDAHMARADEVLLLTTSLAMALLWRLWSAHRADREARGGLPVALAAAFWLAVGLGILAKGPITPFVAGSCALVCTAARRDWRFLWRLRPFTGIVVLAALALPWFALVARELGIEALEAAFRREVLDRAREGAEGNGAPPGYYLLTIMAFFFPGALLLALGFERLVRRAFAARHAAGTPLLARMRARFGSTRGRDAEIFLLGWIVPTWIAFEFVATKLPHYLLPVYPALALMVARLALGGLRALPKPINAGDRATFAAWMAVGAILSLAGGALALWLAMSGRTATGPTWPPVESPGTLGLVLGSVAAIAAVVLTFRGFRAAVAGGFVRALVLGTVATVLAEMALFGAFVPSLGWVWNTPRIVGAMVADSGRTPADADFPRIAGVGYQEDSLLWTTRARLDRFGDRIDGSNRAALHAWCDANPGGYLLIPREDVEEFRVRGEIVAELEGFNYSDGDPVRHVLVRVGPPPNPRDPGQPEGNR